ncbi:uncharacterized protein [Porites lutea]|uniref:uncharacterized protein n=1 Tax=Porites lutea TaxID=51062 RepID=UPI003CC5F6A2
MAVDPLSQLTSRDVSVYGEYRDSKLVKSYCTGYTGLEQNCSSCQEGDTGVDNVGHIPEEDMSIGSSTDDSVATASAVFRHLDNLIRRRIDGEIEQLKSSVHQILSDQQQEFAQAFGLQDDHSSSEASTSHVVPGGNFYDDSSSDVMEDSSDYDTAVMRQYDYTETLCSNCKSDLRNTNTIPQEEIREDEEKIVMNYLLRLMTASSAMGNTLKRKEYRT